MNTTSGTFNLIFSFFKEEFKKKQFLICSLVRIGHNFAAHFTSGDYGSTILEYTQTEDASTQSKSVIDFSRRFLENYNKFK